MKSIDFYRESKFIHLVQELYTKTTFNDILEFVFQAFRVYIPFHRISMVIADQEREFISNRKVISEEPVFYRAYEVPLNQTILGQVFETGLPGVVNNLEVYLDKNPDSLWTQEMLREGLQASLILPLKVRGENIGAVIFFHREPNTYNESHLEFLRFIASHFSTVFEKSFLMRELALTTVMGLANLAEKRDLETGQHIQRISYYSRALAIELALNSIYKDRIDEEFIQDIGDFSPLHDIGKVGISDAILRKPGRLTPEEFIEMRQHTVIGKEILEAIEENLKQKGFSFFKMGIEIVYCHQEKFDGSGYPRGLKGEAIPLSARLVSVCDVFDACSLKRVYKEAYTLDESFQIVEQGKGNHFDPIMVEAFKNIREKIEKIYQKFRD